MQHTPDRVTSVTRPTTVGTVDSLRGKRAPVFLEDLEEFDPLLHTNARRRVEIMAEEKRIEQVNVVHQWPLKITQAFFIIQNYGFDEYCSSRKVAPKGIPRVCLAKQVSARPGLIIDSSIQPPPSN